ncbi:MAG: hypothetical protein ACM3O7_09375 [Acidobacteriota bacterium]
MPEYAEITITVKNGVISCQPDPGQCYWATGPADVRWTTQSSPSGATLVEVMWKAKSPFSGQSQSGGSLGPITTSGNLQVAGEFGYTVRFIDSQGRVVLQVDPTIRNNDRP